MPYYESQADHSVTINVDIDWSIAKSSEIWLFWKREAEEIKLLVCNIDGCLTSGHIYVSGDQKETLSYDVKGAIGVSLLKKSSFEVRLKSGRACSKQPFSTLKLDCKTEDNVSDKLVIMDEWKKEMSLSWKEVVCLGTEVSTEECLKREQV